LRLRIVPSLRLICIESIESGITGSIINNSLSKTNELILLQIESGCAFEIEKVSNLFSIKVENEIFTNFSYRVNLFDLIIADSVMLLSALSNG
jgi:hypothetical protein